jgi:hypothetical protein
VSSHPDRQYCLVFKILICYTSNSKVILRSALHDVGDIKFIFLNPWKKLFTITRQTSNEDLKILQPSASFRSEAIKVLQL